MPITFQREGEGFDLHVRMQGEIRPADIDEYFQQIVGNGDSFAGSRTIVEVDGASFRGFSFPIVRKFAQLTRTYEPALANSRTAVVAPGGLAYGLVRMYISTRNPDYEFRVFRQPEEALTWLQTETSAGA